MTDHKLSGIVILAFIVMTILCLLLGHDRDRWRDVAKAEQADNVYGIIIDEHTCPQPEVPEWVKDDFEHLINNGGFSIGFGLAGHGEDIVILSGKSVENFADKIGINFIDRYYIFMVSGDAFEVTND